MLKRVKVKLGFELGQSGLEACALFTAFRCKRVLPFLLPINDKN